METFKLGSAKLGSAKLGSAKLGSALATLVIIAPAAYAAPIFATMPVLSTPTPTAYNGDPYSPHRGGGRKSHASKKTPEPRADTSKGETADQNRAYLKRYGF